LIVLVERCWATNPIERPTFQEIFSALAESQYLTRN
jgi:hypothetical protein